MREVLCGFKDEAEYRSSTPTDDSWITISGDELRIFETVEARLTVRTLGVSEKVHAKVVRKQPLMIDDGLSPRVWRYTFRVDGDQVWLNMFKQKIATLAGFGNQAA